MTIEATGEDFQQCLACLCLGCSYFKCKRWHGSVLQSLHCSAFPKQGSLPARLSWQSLHLFCLPPPQGAVHWYWDQEVQSVQVPAFWASVEVRSGSVFWTSDLEWTRLLKISLWYPIWQVKTSSNSTENVLKAGTILFTNILPNIIDIQIQYLN